MTTAPDTDPGNTLVRTSNGSVATYSLDRGILCRERTIGAESWFAARNGRRSGYYTSRQAATDWLRRR